MFIIDKIFTSKSKPQKTNRGIYIYLDNQLKRKIQTNDQTVYQYINDNQFDSDQFLYLLLKSKRTQEVYSKRKLNSYEKFSQCLESIPEDCKGYIVMGYSTDRNSAPRVSSHMPISDNPKCIRSGALQIFVDGKNIFQQCQLRLHYDYLTYYKIKAKEKKVSFIPLENSIVETMSENKYAFVVKDKFKNIIFKTNSKEDMIGWLLAISEAIKIRSSQIYLTQFDQKLSKSLKQRLNAYSAKCLGLKQHSKIILLDQIGRKAIKSYLTKKQAPQIDFKLLNIIEDYLEMVKIRRQKGETNTEELIEVIKRKIYSIFEETNQIFKPRQLDSNHQFVKMIQEIMKYLDNKYKKQVVEKKYMSHTFQHHLTDQYRKKSRIPMKSLFGHVEVNQNQSQRDERVKSNNLHMDSSFYSETQSPRKGSRNFL